MTTHAVERERFQATMEAEGMPREISRRILRHAQTIQRLAELACSSEAADQDQVRCPRNGSPCLCEDYGAAEIETVDPATNGGIIRRVTHGRVPRYMVQSAQAERLIREWCDKATKYGPIFDGRHDECREEMGRHAHKLAFVPIFQGDPRGACVKIRVPSGRTDDTAREGICVPTR